MPALAHQADTGPKRVQSPFGRKTVSKTNRTKVLDTTELISTRHDCLSFAPGYSKGLSLKLWIFFHKQKDSKAPSKMGSGRSGGHKRHLKETFNVERKGEQTTL